jgi:hypothetical protein
MSTPNPPNTPSAPAFLPSVLVLLAPFRLAAENEQYLRNLAAAVGWDLDEVVGFDAAAAAADLRAIAQGVDTIANFIGDPPDSLPEFVAALEVAERTFEAVRDVGRILGDAGTANLDDFAKALLEALVIASWFQRSPISFSIAELLGLVVGPDDGDPLPAIHDGDRVLRARHRRGRLRLNQLKPLLRDPVETLREEYFADDALATVAGAHRSADKLFPRLARLAHFLGLNSHYRFEPAVPVTGGAAVLDRLAHMLTLYVAPHDGEAYGVTLAMSSAERGRRGLIVRPFGSIAFRSDAGDWKLSLDGGGSIRGLLIGPGGVETSGGERWTLQVAAERIEEIETVPMTLGGGGSGLTIGTLRVEGDLDLGSQSPDAALNLIVERAHVALAGSDGDGFLSSVLPAEGLSADIDFAIGWSSAHGFHVSGSANLEARFPLDARIGPVTLHALNLAIAAESDEGGIATQVSFGAGLDLGPFAVVIDRVGLQALIDFPEAGGNLGPLDVDFGFKPPKGVGLTINTSLVVGGGFLFFDPEKAEYGGILQLEVANTIAVKAIGLITTRLPDGSKGFSLLILMSAEGFAPIQLGFGFTLTGVGGLLGVNRTVRVEVLRNGLQQGTLGSILFPADPIRNAAQIVSDLRNVFPPAKNRYLFGPMAIIGWGTPTVLTVELALILEVPEPVRLVILGRLTALLPEARTAVVRVRMDAIGVIDFNRGEVALDATLYDSRILTFALTGAMALRAAWGAAPTFVLAIGGFNPRFAAPAGFPRLARLALSLSSGDALRLRCECYLALTSNTAQFGARLDLHAAGGGFTLDGHLSVDALFHFAPFAFVVDVGAGVALRYHGHLLMGIHLEGTLSGPSPWHVRGKATFKVLFFKVSVSVDHRIGEEAPGELPEAVDVLGRLVAAVADPRNWSSELPPGEHALVTLRDAATPRRRAHPRAVLTVRQRVVPLNVQIERYGTAPVAGADRFTLDAVGTDGGAVSLGVTRLSDAFALGQFRVLSDDEQLTRPSFEQAEAGLRVGSDAVSYAYDGLTDGEIRYETQLVVPGQGPLPEPATRGYVMPATVFEAVAVTGAAGQAAIRRTGPARYRPQEAA